MTKEHWRSYTNKVKETCPHSHLAGYAVYHIIRWESERAGAPDLLPTLPCFTREDYTAQNFHITSPWPSYQAWLHLGACNKLQSPRCTTSVSTGVPQYDARHCS
jgi:hypothetical protein